MRFFETIPPFFELQQYTHFQRLRIIVASHEVASLSIPIVYAWHALIGNKSDTNVSRTSISLTHWLKNKMIIIHFNLEL